MKNPTHYQHLDAGSDTNGNPRRGFVLYDAQGDIVQAIDEGYRGMPSKCRGLVQLPSYGISATTRRELLRTYSEVQP